MGEIIAIEYLQSKGYKILTTNYKFGRFGEIDIISFYEGLTIFTEVKYRRSKVFGTAEEAITKPKLRKLQKTMYSYCMKHHIDLEKIRFDVVTIQKRATCNRVTHYKNIEI